MIKSISGLNLGSLDFKFSVLSRESKSRLNLVRNLTPYFLTCISETALKNLTSKKKNPDLKMARTE